jgi:hypothetical protein
VPLEVFLALCLVRDFVDFQGDLEEVEWDSMKGCATGLYREVLQVRFSTACLP